MKIKIEPLAEHLHHLAELAAWHQAQFGYLNTSVTLEQRVDRLKASAQTGRLPMAYVALSENQLLGSASLLSQTITHAHLSPWLSSVYVALHHRGQGIASALIRNMVHEAARIGVKEVYLFTPSSEALYARLGWKVLEYADHKGLPLTIMSVRTGIPGTP